MFEEKKGGGAKNIWCPNEYYYDGSEFNGTDVTTKAKTGKTVGFYKNNFAADYVEAVSRMKAWNDAEEEAYKGVKLTGFTHTEQKAYSGVKPASEEDKTLLATLTSASTINGVIDGYGLSGDLKYAVVDVTVWIEGTDGDCFDAILGDMMAITLAFKGEE